MLSPSDPSAPRKLTLTAVVALAIACVTAVAALWLCNPDAERKAIGRLPEQERRALYQRTLHTLESSCDLEKRPSGLEDFCRDQADFIVQFPECDAACSSLAGQHRSTPSR